MNETTQKAIDRVNEHHNQKYYWLNEDSREFLREGYLLEGTSAEERVRDIAEHAEEILGEDGFADKFEEYMSRGYYSLASPVWSNFGLDRGMPISCFGSHIEDDMTSILYTHAEVGQMTKHGGGTSGYLGELRPRGAPITNNGKSNGSYSFTELFDTAINVVSQGETRRGQFAGYIDVEHDDLDEWLNIKTEGDPVQDIYYGVIIGDEWFQSMIDGDQEKREKWASIIETRINIGVPYIIFRDNMNNGKPQVYKDKNYQINASNLCLTGDQRVVTERGYKKAEDLYEDGGELTLFDGEKAIGSSEMKLREKDADVYTFTLDNGIEQTVTEYHGMAVYDESGEYTRTEAQDVEEGDKIVVQTKKGLFGDVHKPEEAFNLGSEEKRPEEWVYESDEETVWNYIDGVLSGSARVYSTDGSSESGIVSYKNTNHEMLQELQLLCNNLGMKSEIQHDSLEIKDIEDRDSTNEAYEVVDIEYAGTEDVYCPTTETDESVFISQGALTFNCTEIALPASADESFVCCLSSMNALHYDEWKDTDAVETLTYFLDAVMEEFIEQAEGIEFMERAVRFAKRHRAVGIGVLGWHSYLQSQMIPFDSMDAMQKNGQIFQTIKEKSYEASEEMAEKFGEPEVMEGYGRRNATTMAVAPTKSSSIILGQVSPSIEPLKANYFVRDGAKLKSTQKNRFLEAILEERGEDTRETWDKIAQKDGSVQHLDCLTEHEKEVFKTFSEIPQMSIINQAAQRQDYIDQSQSLNISLDPEKVSVKKINQLYIQAWEKGVKSMYYQNSVNAAQKFSRNILECKACEG